MAAAVPAWRRLGLKLKSEDAGVVQAPLFTQSLPQENLSNGQKSQPSASAAEPGQSERRVPSVSTNGSSAPLRSSLKTNSSPAPSKTVSFHSTPDDTTSCPATPAGAPAAASSFNHDQSQDVDEPAAISRRHEAKREKRKLRQEQSRDSDISTKPYLTYLEEHSQVREQWKFNKNHQNQLFKYLFDVHKIPPEFEDALAEYVAGLKGQSARDRIANSARTILAELENDPEAQLPDDETDPAMDSAENRQQAQQDAQGRDAKKVKSILKKRYDSHITKAYEQEFPVKLRRRQRAHRLLNIVCQNRGIDDSKAPNTTPLKIKFGDEEDSQAKKIADSKKSSSTSKTSQPQPPVKKRSRGRKRRGLQTGVPDDDELTDSSSAISDPSSSEQDSDDTEDESPPMKKPKSS